MTDIHSILNGFSPVTLEEMDNVKLMNRTDTKFIFNVERLPSLLNEASAYYNMLEIDAKRNLSYRTVYFDTKDFAMYLAHQNGKLNRYKIRFREYLISNTSYLEIKLKSNKGKTIKKRMKRTETELSFSDKAKRFIEKNTPFSATELMPKLWNQFTRLTLVHKEEKERITIDTNLAYKNNELQQALELPFLAIAEVKQEGFSRLSDFIQLLKKEGIYDSNMSKYCIGTLLLNKEIKYNRFKDRLLTLNKISNDNNYSKLFTKN